MILHLKINLDYPRFFEVCDHFGALGVKVLKCQIYLKGVTYVNIEESRLSNEQYKMFIQMKKLTGYWKMHYKF